MANKDLFSCFLIQWLPPPLSEQGNLRSVEDGRITAKAIILLQNTEGEFLQLGRFVRHNNPVGTNLIPQIHFIQ